MSRDSVETPGKIQSAKKKKNGMKHADPGSESVGKGKKGGVGVQNVEREELEGWAKEDASALELLVSLIPKQHYAAPSDNAQVPTKYMKKPNDTVSKKALRAERNAKKREKFQTDEEKDEDDEDDEDDDDEEEEETSKAAARQKPGKTEGGKTTTFSEERVSNVSELKERLKRKLEALRGNRPEPKEDGERSSKAQKRADKKDKKKQTREKQKQKEASVPIPSPMPKQDAVKSKPKASAAGDEAFSFGRIKMGGEDVVGGGRNKDKKYRDRPEVLLKKIEEKKQKLQEVGEETEEGKKMKAKQQWGAAIDRAQGVKVKDDAALLQKTIKKKDKAKAKASEKWLKRAKDIEETRSKRAKERNENIKSRILERRNKKIGIKKTKNKDSGGKPKSKGKSKPGF